jgi:hypothetical protein
VAFNSSAESADPQSWTALSGFKKSQKRRTFVKRIRIYSALLALAVLAALAIVITTSKHGVRAVYASTGCTDATLTSNYAFTLSGFVTPQRETTGNEVPVAAVGVFTFDGAGNFSAILSYSINGKIVAGDTSSGTNTVNGNCTGTLSFTTGDVAGSNFNMVIIGGGAEAFAISTLPGITQTVDLKKQ